MSVESRLAIATDGFRSSESSGSTTLVYTGQSSDIISESMGDIIASHNIADNSISLTENDAITVSDSNNNSTIISSEESAQVSIG